MREKIGRKNGDHLMNLKMHWVAALLGSLGALNSAAWSPPVNEFAEVFFCS